MKGRTLFLALVAALSVLSATAVASGHRVVQGSKGDDELKMGSAANRVFARGGDDTVNAGGGNDRVRGGRGDDALFGGRGGDRLMGGQDDDLLDGGPGDDVLNGAGDGRDKDRIVCGEGDDTVILGKGDVILVEVSAAEHPGQGPVLDKPEGADGDGCEEVKGPGGEPRVCASHQPSCEDVEEPCAANDGGCEPYDEPCVATYRDCDDPVVEEPAPDEPVEVPDSEEP